MQRNVPNAAISAVNFSEAVAKLRQRDWSTPDAERAMSALHLDVRPFDEEQAFLAGDMRPVTRQFGLSLGARACLVLAQSLSGTAVTTDRVWAKLDIGIPIEVIR